MRLFRGLRHRAHVTAGAESPARSGYDDGSDVRIRAPGAKSIDGGGQQLSIQSVELIGTVEGENGNSILHFDVDHGT